MDFTSAIFLGYLLLTALAYSLASGRVRPVVLLIASYFFYWLNSHALLLLLVGDTALIFYAALVVKRLERKPQRAFVTFAASGLLVSTLVLFKGAFLLPGGWERRLLIPLGVSYYTFKLIGYLIDVYWEVTEPSRNLVAFAAYTAFFPQIVAGPIQRAEQFLPQLEAPVAVTRSAVVTGCLRILLGFFKKFVVADNLATLVNFLYAHLHAGHQPLLLAFYGYPLQMYADFSALTDISVGAALLFGIIAPENFEAPFSAPSPSEYWRRWHITLTLWLTDYVFTPLRMSLRNLGNAGLVLSLTLNMVLIGLWHGFRWSFVVFGLVHALYLSVDALTAKARRTYYKQHPAARTWAGRIGPVFTFHLVAVAFVCFRAPTFADIVFVLTHLFDGLTAQSPEFATLIAVSGHAILVGAAGYAFAEVFDYLRRKNARTPLLPELPRWARWSVYSCTAMATVLLVMLLVVNGAKRSPFLYAIF